MRSRFEWGLITDVQAPELETRIAILRKKAQSDHLQVPDDILEFMASKVSSNIRELEGTLIRVTAFASLNRTAVDMALVQTVLKDLITLDDDNVVAPTDIINHTAEYFKLSVDDLYGSSRSRRSRRPGRSRCTSAVSSRACRCRRSASCSATATTPP